MRYVFIGVDSLVETRVPIETLALNLFILIVENGISTDSVSPKLFQSVGRT